MLITVFLDLQTTGFVILALLEPSFSAFRMLSSGCLFLKPFHQSFDGQLFLKRVTRSLLQSSPVRLRSFCLETPIPCLYASLSGSTIPVSTSSGRADFLPNLLSISDFPEILFFRVDLGIRKVFSAFLIDIVPFFIDSTAFCSVIYCM